MQENWNIGKATAVIPPLKRLPTLLAIQAAQVGPVGAVWDSSGSCPFAAVGQRHLYLRRHRASFLTVSLDTWVNGISLYTIWLLLVANFGELRLREVQLPRIPLPRTPVNRGVALSRPRSRLRRPRLSPQALSTAPSRPSLPPRSWSPPLSSCRRWQGGA